MGARNVGRQRQTDHWIFDVKNFDKQKGEKKEPKTVLGVRQP